MNETLYLGKKISRLRERKHEALGEQLGISQQAISKSEQSQHVEEPARARLITEILRTNFI